jgi:hypothetical protein
MDESSILLGVIMMMVASVGVLLYVVLVLTIAACRLLDWLSISGPADHATRVRHRRI